MVVDLELGFDLMASTTRCVRGAIALLFDALSEHRAADHVLDDAAAQFATHVLAELGAILLLILF